jgi:hypothetical protein
LEIAPRRYGATPAITFARGKAGAIDSVAGSGNIHASASTLDAHPI